MTATRAMIAKVHIAAKDLALTDDTRRALMNRVVGKESCAAMSPAELDKVLGEFKRLGWRPKVKAGGKAATAKPGRRPVADSPVARKARALWISLHRLGVIKNGSEKALEAFARRQLKVDALAWMTDGEGFRLIEALKAMAERAGWSQDVGDLEGEEAGRLLQGRLEALLEARQRS